MLTTLAVLFGLNAIAHIYSYSLLNKLNDPAKNGVLAFVFINLLMAVFLFQDFTWTKWPILLFPLIGLLGLTVSTLIPKKGKWIDYLIALLDLATIILVVKYFFMS